MKKLISLFVCISLLCLSCVALADGKVTPPAETTVTTIAQAVEDVNGDGAADTVTLTGKQVPDAVYVENLSLTVKDGEMTIHVSLVSKTILNLFPGLAEDAQKDGAVLLQPTTDTVTYSDGLSEEVYGFDIPVPALDTEFDLALIGKKGVWYDHKVSVSNPVAVEETDSK